VKMTRELIDQAIWLLTQSETLVQLSPDTLKIKPIMANFVDSPSLTLADLVVYSGDVFPNPDEVTPDTELALDREAETESWVISLPLDAPLKIKLLSPPANQSVYGIAILNSAETELLLWEKFPVPVLFTYLQQTYFAANPSMRLPDSMFR